jgi:hypothetical protein
MSKKVPIAAPRRVKGLAEEAEAWVTERPAPSKPAEPMKRLTIDLPDSLHHRLKIYCVTHRLQMVDVVRGLVAEYVEKKVRP